METKDWITIISVIAVIIRWFVNGQLNRSNEIAKKRFEYRINALQSFLKVWFFIQKTPTPFINPLFLPMLEEARSNFQLYGKDDEIALFENFIQSIEQQNLQQAYEALN
ncbi:MAG: hypothetical protein R2863_05915 [Candidatus Kapaibacterium sp.]